jgi:MOSC domain-containing protein YiiM
MPEDTINTALLTEYEARLAALHFETIGFVEALFVSPRPDEHQPVRSLRVVPEVGVEGQYPGKQWWRGKRIAGRQISAMNAEVLDALEIDYAVPGDNLVIRGINLEEFEPGDTLRIGEALLSVTPTPHRPCAKLAARTTLTKKTAISAGRRRGLLLDARRPATIFCGDAVERLCFSRESVLISV